MGGIVSEPIKISTVRPVAPETLGDLEALLDLLREKGVAEMVAGEFSVALSTDAPSKAAEKAKNAPPEEKDALTGLTPSEARDWFDSAD